MATTIDALPGFRRRFVVQPGSGQVRCDVEDDYHCMSVSIHHEGGVAIAVEGRMPRVPWSTCPGARAMLVETFTGVPLAAFAVRGAKKANCTHLFDLAVLAAAHAFDPRPLVYDLLASDPRDGRVEAELRRDGETVMDWSMEHDRIVDPPILHGLRLDELGTWVASLDAERQEQARILRWGTMLAHGRRSDPLPLAYEKSDAFRGQCFSFQPGTYEQAEYVTGSIRDFSTSGAVPLAALITAPIAGSAE